MVLNASSEDRGRLGNRDALRGGVSLGRNPKASLDAIASRRVRMKRQPPRVEPTRGNGSTAACSTSRGLPSPPPLPRRGEAELRSQRTHGTGFFFLFFFKEEVSVLEILEEGFFQAVFREGFGSASASISLSISIDRRSLIALTAATSAPRPAPQIRRDDGVHVQSR